MTDRDRRRLFSRHVRVHLRLLTLLRQTSEAPAAMAPSAWGKWLAAREMNLAGVAAGGCASLAADTARAIEAGDSCADLLRQFHQSEVRMMAAVLAYDEQMQTTFARRLRAMARQLGGRRRAATTRKHYQT